MFTGNRQNLASFAMFRRFLWVSTSFNTKIPSLKCQSRYVSRLRNWSHASWDSMAFWCHLGFIYCYFDEDSGLITKIITCGQFGTGLWLTKSPSSIPKLLGMKFCDWLNWTQDFQYQEHSQGVSPKLLLKIHGSWNESLRVDALYEVPGLP